MPTSARARASAFTLVELPVVSQRKRHAFTLVELLVVIAIIGTLVAILLPAIQSARETARRGTCLNNIRNLAQATFGYEVSKLRLPGYSQLVKRGETEAVGVAPQSSRWAIVTVDPGTAVPVSWAAMLLPHIERQDIWDRLINPKVDPILAPNLREGVLEIRPVEIYICPSDRDATAAPDLPALSFSVNAGAPDWDNGDFLAGVNPTRGDTPNNGLFLNRYELVVRNLKMRATRLSNIYDGSTTTIMLSENCHKSYEPAGPFFPPRFTWLFGTEQQLAIVWVANVNPQPGDTIVDQERINRAAEEVFDDDPVFDPNSSRFARPASNHPGGVNAAYADSHADFLAEDIDYLVYQSLLTPHGRKCVDTRDWAANLDFGEPIDTFRKAPPLSDADF